MVDRERPRDQPTLGNRRRGHLALVPPAGGDPASDRVGRRFGGAAPLEAPRRPPLVPLLGAADPITDERERILTGLARAARAGDHDARDALYAALGPKIDRFVAGCWRRAWTAAGPRRDGRPWDVEDIAQEAFPIFADLVAGWPGDGPFAPYFLAHFPWRLRTAWRGMRPPPPIDPRQVASRLVLLADDSAAADEARALVAALAAALPSPDDAILLAHVRDGVPLVTLGQRLGLPRRTVSRRWQAVKSWLRSESRIGGERRRPPAARSRRNGVTAEE